MREHSIDIDKVADGAFASSIAGLFDSERFSDVTIVCEGFRLHAHKAIICTQSDFFAKACEGSFKEGQTGVIELKDDDPQAVFAVLSFLYSKHYSDTPILAEFAPLTLNVRVFALAEKYFIKPLLRVAADKFEAVLNTKYVEDNFAEAIEEWAEIATDNDKILGKIIVGNIMARKADLLNPEKANSKFRDMMNRIPWLAAEIAMMLTSSKASAPVEVGVYTCPGRDGCRSQFAANAHNEKRYRYSCPNCRRTIEFNPEHYRKAAYRYVELEEV